MTAKAYLRGHEIEYLDGHWVYSDNKEDTVTTYEQRPCGKCGKNSTMKDHDACIANLPGVMNACCGHGNATQAYIQFTNGVRIEGFTKIQPAVSSEPVTGRREMKRSVKIFRHEQVEGSTYFQKVEDVEGFFHQFGMAYEEFESGPANYSTAIVELHDGTIRNVPVELIKFLDKEEQTDARE